MQLPLAKSAFSRPPTKCSYWANRCTRIRFCMTSRLPQWQAGGQAHLAECVQKMRRALGPQHLSTREIERATCADGHIPPLSLAPGELWPPRVAGS